MLLTRKLNKRLIAQVEKCAGSQIHHVNNYLSMYKAHLSVVDQPSLMPADRTQYGTPLFIFWKAKKVLDIFVGMKIKSIKVAEKRFEKNLKAGIYGPPEQWEL